MMPRTTLTQLLADPTSAAPAVITESPAVVLTYRALAEQVERLAEQLRSAGLRPGDCVVLVLPNGLEFIVVLLAIAAAGLTAAPLNPTNKTDELLRLRFQYATGQLENVRRVGQVRREIARAKTIATARSKGLESAPGQSAGQG